MIGHSAAAWISTPDGCARCLGGTRGWIVQTQACIPAPPGCTCWNSILLPLPNADTVRCSRGRARSRCYAFIRREAHGPAEVIEDAIAIATVHRHS